MDRKDFLKITATAAAGSLVSPELFARPMSVSGELKIKKSLKYGMIKEDGLSIMDKFKMLKDIGFDGVELDSPNDLDMKEVW